MQSLMIRLLAETDSIFEPIRSWKNPANVIAIVERRDDFRHIGLPIPKTGGDGTARQRFSRWLDSVEKGGRIIFHRNCGKRTHWRLSTGSDWRLRSVCTAWKFVDCLCAMLVLRELADAGITNGQHVGDWLIASDHPQENNDRIFDLEAIFAPALCRGWVTSWSDGQGKTGYHLRDAGRAFLDTWRKPPTETDFEPTKGALYLKSHAEERKNIQTLKPRRIGTLPIPLPSGDWPSRPVGVPAVFDAAGKVRTPQDVIRQILKALG